VDRSVHVAFIGTHQIRIIPHGIPDMAPCDQDELKAGFGVAGHRMLLTFGLVGPNEMLELAGEGLEYDESSVPDDVGERRPC